MVQEGDKAPDFCLPAAGGTEVRLSDMTGKKVVVYFYPKDDTSGCTKEAIAFNALRNEFEAADTHVVGISADSVARHDRFRAKHDLAITLASDEDRKAIEAYGAWGEKTMYGRKFMGILRSTFLIGRDGRIARIWRNVKVDGHADEVLATARAL
ncbi:MAG: thioredoxin-dependent thiol peroxidase [Pseudomonadota bacterium]|jgi:peroxiredoxin Q/BCP|nr:MAG: thioredoxin-dependent thiol peroxidase [Pseudomonadota bacterium]